MKSSQLSILLIVIILFVASISTSAQETILLYDDFDDTNLDTMNWFYERNGNGNYGISNGIITLNSGTQTGAGSSIKSHQIFELNNETLIL
jgi:hypothetical protein